MFSSVGSADSSSIGSGSRGKAYTNPYEPTKWCNATVPVITKRPKFIARCNQKFSDVDICSTLMSCIKNKKNFALNCCEFIFTST